MMEEKPKYALSPVAVQNANSLIGDASAMAAASLALDGRYAQLVAQIAGWPPFYPPSCPPSGAKPEDLEVYRLVENTPPVRNDFASHVEAKKYYRPEEMCRACGLSVYRDLNHIKATRSKFKPLKGMMIAKGRIMVDDGFVMQTSTPISHYTWWVRCDAPESGFQEVIKE
jgi:hypothetical protein